MLIPVRSLAYSAFAIRRRLHEYNWRVRNAVRHPSIHVAGEYFAGNLGDWTMGQAFLSENRMAGLAAYSGKPGSARSVVMGGGEIGDASHFERAIQMAGRAEAVAACGINPVYTFDRLPEHLLEQIALMPYLSVRSKDGAQRMRRVLSRPDVEFNPDPSFCFALSIPSPVDTPRRLAISLMTFYLSVQNRRRFEADQTLKSVVADQEFAARIDKAGICYIEMMQAIINRFVAEGWEIVNIPFSEVDAMFAETILSDTPVKRLPYSRNPVCVLDSLRTCRRYIATRFHSHIFGLMAGVPVVSIGYANKCVQLWGELGLNEARQISRLDVCRDPLGSAARLANDEGSRLSSEKLSSLAQAARLSIRRAMEAVQ